MARTLSEINTDLTNAYAARTRILTGGQSKGADGANKNEVSFAELQALIKDLETEKASATPGNSGGVSFTPTIGA